MKFVFDTDWMDSLTGCSAEVRLEVYEAVIRYAASGTLSALKPTAKLAFSFIKSQIDSGAAYSSMMKELGRKGAQKRWGIAANSGANSGYIAAINTEKEAPEEKVTPKELPEEKEQEKDIDKSISKKKFIKPTEEEVAAYCKERNNNISATQFMAYYESNGWKVGRDSMKDWKAAVRYWEQTRKERKQNYSVSRTDSRAPLPKDYTGYYEQGGFEI